MERLKDLGLWPSGLNFRRSGRNIALCSVALAAFLDNWQGGFLLGMFLLGLGVGLGKWEMGVVR